MPNKLIPDDTPERCMGDVPAPSDRDSSQTVNGAGAADKFVPPIELLQSIVYGPRRANNGAFNSFDSRIGSIVIENLLREDGTLLEMTS
jgi:hypothetical protein